MSKSYSIITSTRHTGLKPSGSDLNPSNVSIFDILLVIRSFPTVLMIQFVMCIFSLLEQVHNKVDTVSSLSLAQHNGEVWESQTGHVVALLVLGSFVVLRC